MLLADMYNVYAVVISIVTGSAFHKLGRGGVYPLGGGKNPKRVRSMECVKALRMRLAESGRMGSGPTPPARPCGHAFEQTRPVPSPRLQCPGSQPLATATARCSSEQISFPIQTAILLDPQPLFWDHLHSDNSGVPSACFPQPPTLCKFACFDSSPASTHLRLEQQEDTEGYSAPTSPADLHQVCKHHTNSSRVIIIFLLTCKRFFLVGL
mmetsp:Transcript_11060/g.31016  ORF Transcript_11060/g.31016 Transcript_11060/m.31016 type:complete len:210 (+) Transcript_11060:933-1562(+)